MHEAQTKRTVQRFAAFVLAAVLSLFSCCQWAWATPGERCLIPLGKAVGIKLFADGVLIVATSEVEVQGKTVSPARDCGLKEGDLLLRMNEQKIESTEHLQSLLQESGADAVTLSVKRGSKTMDVSAKPVVCGDGVCRLGAWIRDSMAGIGTLTYYDPTSGEYGALGHGITDVDTHQLMPLSSGSIMETTVKAVKKGTRGDPGELKGDFSVQRDVGTVSANTEGGIFGTVDDQNFLSKAKAIPVASVQEVTIGKATILATVSGSETQEYAVEIVKLYDGSQPTRNLLLRVTDQRLLNTTGGIVQGMSGSPILQNGKFVGAVTHVLVNDPQQGYGILMENMLHAAG